MADSREPRSDQRSNTPTRVFTNWDGVMAELFDLDSLDARLQPGVTSCHDKAETKRPMSTFKYPFEVDTTTDQCQRVKSSRPVNPHERKSILHKQSHGSETESQTSSSDKSVTFAVTACARSRHDDVMAAVDHVIRAMTPEPYIETRSHSSLGQTSLGHTSLGHSSLGHTPPAKVSRDAHRVVTLATVHHKPNTNHVTRTYNDNDVDEYDYDPDDYYALSQSPPTGHGGYYTSSPIGQDTNYHEPTSDYSSGNLSNTSQRDILDTQIILGKKRNRRKLSYFDVLPDHCIIRIFSHLSTLQLCKCSRISRRWYGLVWDASLWTTISISDGQYDVDNGLKVLTTRLSYDTPFVCMSVQNVVLNNCTRLTDRGLKYLSQRCPELLRLEIRGCTSVSNWALFEIVSNCTNLQHIDTTGCTAITCISLTPEASQRSRPLRNKQILLRHLDLTDCTNLEDSGLSIIASHCTQLVYLYLRRCVRVTDIGIQYVATYCTMLKELSACDCRRITDFGLRELSKLNVSLRYLSVAKCERISDVGVMYLARFCHRLRYLNVRGCEAVSDDSIIPLAKSCRRLRSLDVGKCDVTDDSLITLATNCAQLKKISVKACDGITNTGIMALARKCPQLEQLNIQECHLSVEAYRAVKSHCKRCIIEHTNPGFC